MYMNKKVNILFFDPAPHMLAFFAKHIQNLDLAYQLFYKIAKHYETCCIGSYGGKYLEFLVKLVATFI